MTAILEVRSLHKHFGGAKVLQDVDLAIDTGEIHCLIGPNGAGKSTLFKVMVGTYEPSAGSVVFVGEDVTRRKPFERVRRGMSIKMQVPSIFRELPVRQNLVIAPGPPAGLTVRTWAIRGCSRRSRARSPAFSPYGMAGAR